jgi:dephospho-CoA kinase
MIAALMPAELKRARADIILENNGTLGQLERRVHDVWSVLFEEADARRPAVIP